ncbi:MAG: polysaccharide pyruvyl transferase family protein [Synergistaceae bacterium]|nr:polysaccharide pyruvyl transferase family protein [Candidatus Equadaptatus faecalis]
MQKIAIVTLFLNNNNYGGTLQAYALCAFLKKNNINAEQISYNFRQSKKITVSNIRFRFLKRVLHKCLSLLWRLKNILFPDKAHKICALCKKEFQQREENYINFRKNFVPHSQRIYSETTLPACVDDYDAFIVGSDQVWNFNWSSLPFFLNFVPSTKIKLSYAASIGKDDLTDGEKNIFRKYLADFTAISVREKSTQEILSKELGRNVAWTVDPTLLLDKEDWDEICSDKKYDFPYLFCYFLGSDNDQRLLAEKYAKQHGLKIVSIPHATGTSLWSVCLNDVDFGDYQECDASPEDFLALIRNADMVFTDSFHACVFSCIFQRQFFAFQRLEYGGMSSRIYSLLEMFGLSERFCDSEKKRTMEYIELQKKAEYSEIPQKFKERRELSERFLAENLR